MPDSYVCGLDLGQAQDYTALAALRRTLREDGKQSYSVCGLIRYPLGCPYVAAEDQPAILPDVCSRCSWPPLRGSPLAVDQTGVGRAAVDALRAASVQVTLIPVTITAGMQTTQQENGDWHVPKRDLVTTLQVLLQSGRLTIEPELRLAATLAEEMISFRVKVTKAANEVFGEWREGMHDDLVLAVALACWAGERFPSFTRASLGVGPRRVSASPPRGAFYTGPGR